MRTGKNWVTVPVYDDNDDCILYEVLVKWEYDPHGGNEVRKYWFEFTAEYPEGIDFQTRKKIDKELTDMPMEQLMISHCD